MKTDKYTKLVLTIIAFCLVWICFKSVNPLQASAHTSNSEVVITGIKIPTTIGQTDKEGSFKSLPVCFEHFYPANDRKREDYPRCAASPNQ